MTDRNGPDEISERIAREATAWFVRLNDPSASTADQADFQRWHSASPTHAAAYARMGELWEGTREVAGALGAGHWYRTPQEAETPHWRGGLLTRAAFAVAALLLVAGGAIWRDPGLFDRLTADYAAAPGSHIERTLTDGTRLYLDGDGAADVRIDERTRELTLLRGRAFVDVAHDAARPFRVHAGGAEVQVLGTAFGVARDAEAVVVTVERGQVAVAAQGTPAGNALLTPGQRVKVADGKVSATQTVDTETALAWRRGLIVFDRASLAEVVEDLDRAMPGRVVLTDPHLRALTLSGVFRADEPGAVLEALRSALGLRTVSIPGIATLIMR
ncbi:FecR family protein [Starkeya sp. ORNL1]|uniref:FecR family protein n=1 Tax=Starkeya sp. ORNL1 TaxID=2709380 RepID=UPI001FEEDCD5|nr:FecR family protein [Starkeya sp. ORNL1]